MEIYIPDIYQKSIYVIDYQKLINRGIKCLLFDLDNTLVPISDKKPSEKLKKFIDKLKEMGFKVVIFTKSNKHRLLPFKNDLDVDCSASSHKPRPTKFLQVLKLYGYSISEVAIIGDQLLTDVLGGNRIGITTILVNPISTKDFFWTRFSRKKEAKIMNKLRDNDLFAKGRYYE